MELIRRETDYAFRALAALALGGDRRVTTTGVARHQAIPRRYAEKVLRKLVAAGIVRGQPGTNGGFRLARPVGDIRMLEVVEAVQGPVQINHCTRGKGCPRQRACAVSPRWQDLQEAVVGFLGQPTLAEILGVSSPSADGEGIDAGLHRPGPRRYRAKR